jgi:hypothetical protein
MELDVVPEEMLEVFCTLDAGERKSGVLFNNAVYFLPNYRPGQASRASGVYAPRNSRQSAREGGEDAVNCYGYVQGQRYINAVWEEAYVD